MRIYAVTLTSHIQRTQVLSNLYPCIHGQTIHGQHLTSSFRNNASNLAGETRLKTTPDRVYPPQLHLLSRV